MSTNQVQFPRRPCSQLGRELNLSMPRSALKMANLWAPGKVPEESLSCNDKTNKHNTKRSKKMFRVYTQFVVPFFEEIDCF